LRLFRAMFLALALFAPITAAVAADPAKLSGAVKTPLTLDDATLNGLPVASVVVSYATASGSAKGTYTGVLVWDLLKKAELVSGAEKARCFGIRCWLRPTTVTPSP